MSNTLPTPQQNIKTIRDMLVQNKKQIEMALPKHLDADRLTRIAMTEIRRNPKLMTCDPLSLFAAVIQSAQLGLEPGMLGQAYLIPYGREAQLQVGFKGLVKLARNSGQVLSFTAEVVYEKDEFEFEYGITEKLRHKPFMGPDRGEMIAAYAIAKFKDGSHQFVVMPIHEVWKIRDEKSQTYKSTKGGTWVTDSSEMVKKTVAKRLCKWLDLSPELHRAVAIDNVADTGQAQRLDLDVFGDDVVDLDPIKEKTDAKKEALKNKLKAKQEDKEKDAGLATDLCRYTKQLPDPAMCDNCQTLEQCDVAVTGREPGSEG